MKDPFLIETKVPSSEKKASLDWDESASDINSTVTDIHDSERRQHEFYLTRIFLLLILVIFSSRLFYLQIIKGSYFQQMAENNRTRSQVLEAPRGLIFDIRQKPLLENIAGYNLIAVPFDLPKENFEAEIVRLASVLNISQEEIYDSLKNINKRSITPVVVKQDISPEMAILFQTRAYDFPGFSVQQSPIRNYFFPEQFSALLGYTGLANSQDLLRLNLSDSDTATQVGKQGLELEYEKFLRGSAGQNQVEIDSTGKILKVLGQKPSRPGDSLILNIDSELQKKLYEELTKNSGGKVRAAAVALNPKTGQVLALLSLPGFDTNLFSHGITQADYQLLLNDPKKPFLNRAISGQYPPGSTVKPMVAAAALAEGIVNEDTIINDKGVLVIPNQFDPTVAYNFVGWKLSGLGPMTVRSAIAQSSDIYFYTVAGGHPNSKIAGLGVLKLAEYYRKFHLGQPLGIDLPGEKSGVVADPSWKEKAFANDPILKKWYLGDTYHIGIGQGDMLATPLQVAYWTAVFANNGVGMKPKILNRVISSEGKNVFENKPEILANKFLSDEIIKVVQEGMRETVLEGSGRQLLGLPITSAGKTGTSQFDGSDPKKTHAWFTAYAPFEDPQIVITVLVEAGGEGHAAAVPVVKEAFSWWAKERYGK
jgi:penicillin-binding protein 2